MIRRLKRENAAARTALDVVCAKETICDIWIAMEPGQLEVAEMLLDGMTMAEVAERLGITRQAVWYRLARARENVARYLFQKHAPELMGDVLMRDRRLRTPQWVHDKREGQAVCVDCGKPIHSRSTRCNRCSMIARYRKRKGEAA